MGVGLCSSVIPYVTDQLAMARLPCATSALMLAILPATATGIGLLVLAQVCTVQDLAGIAWSSPASPYTRTPHRPNRGPSRPGPTHPPPAAPCGRTPGEPAADNGWPA